MEDSFWVTFEVFLVEKGLWDKFLDASALYEPHEFYEFAYAFMRERNILTEYLNYLIRIRTKK
jgi:hypothetical protein